jgi:hypothetical protein
MTAAGMTTASNHLLIIDTRRIIATLHDVSLVSRPTGDALLFSTAMGQFRTIAPRLELS